jgi:exonuclease SbcC
MIEQERKELQNIEHKKTEYEIIKSNVQFLEISQRKSKDILKLKESLSRDINLLEQHCEILKEDLSQFSRFLNTLKVKEDELKMMFSEEKKNEIQLAEARKEQELLNKELERLQIILDEKEIIKKRLATTLETIDWLGQNFLMLMNLTESSVMMKIRTEFSKLFGKWFHMLAGEQFEVKIDETFTPIILQGDQEMDYSFLSGGERTAVALAYRLALNQTINSVLSQIKTREIIILDEPTEGFSETQLERMREVLAELQVKQLIIVSHEQKIESFVENVIKIKKEDSISLKE